MGSLFSSPSPLFIDGAMGTMLQKNGMPTGISPEAFCLSRPDILIAIHKEYIQAGADIILSCTFGASPFKLDPALDVVDTNKRIASLAKEAAKSAGRKIYVAGDIGPSGHFARPLGDIDPEDLIAGFEQQIRGLVAAGVDCLFIETQFDLAEARAIVIAARRVCSLPIMCSMTFEQGVSLTGSTPEIFCETMQNLGVDAIGTNCSLGPDLMVPVVRSLLETSQGTPILAEPNAGLPILQDGKTIFPLSPEQFAELTAPFAKMGVQFLGGCCGTSPEHIRCLRQAVEHIELSSEEKIIAPRRTGITLTTRQKLVRISSEAPFVLIGERINPTGKKQLTQELQEGKFSTALSFADQQLAAGARVLDVNVGAHMVNQQELLPRLVSLLTSKYADPLSLDSSDAEAIIRALPWCPASPLVNSVSGEAERMQILGSACRDYGAPFILLPLQGTKLPVQAKDRIRILEKLLQEAESLGIPKRLMLVDILALSISSKPEGALQCLAMIEWCKEHELPTTIGLSNISFGLPARELINATFLAMAAGAGLTSCIANPISTRICEAFSAIQVLKKHDPQAENFIAGYAEWKSGQSSSGAAIAQKTASQNPYEAVVNGDREHIEELLKAELDKGKEAFDLVNTSLIPAITEVGQRYERKVYFLPQLIRSAETMQLGFASLQPLLSKDADEKRPTIVMATVEGDIHDIGKNIVCLLLGNHGFTVIDAGKDIPAEAIIDCACTNNAQIIGLSALMTTTMVKMEDTIRIIKERKLPIKVMVGGAAVTQSFADAIGADAYCVDAVSAVHAAKKLLGIEE